jgi:hypothetical protein
MGPEESMKTCFGTIYPDLEQIQFGKPMTGKVFQIMVTTLGSGQRDRQLKIDVNAWKDCQLCEDFQNCLDFSNAKLQMQRVLATL